MDLFTQAIHQGTEGDTKPGGGGGLTPGSLSVFILWKSEEGAWQEGFVRPCVLWAASPWLCSPSLRRGRQLTTIFGGPFTLEK